MESTQHIRPSTSTNEPSTSTNKIMVLDGCFESQLKLLDKDQYHSIKSLLAVNMDNKDIAQKVHKSFLEAGANVIRTNTLRASEYLLRIFLCCNDECINDFFFKSVENAKNAVKDYIRTNKKDPKNYMIVGSCGSFTVCSEFPMLESRQSRAEYKEFHKMRAESLIAAKVDGLAFESIPFAEEAYAIVELMNELQYSEVWISFKPMVGIGTMLYCGNKLSDVARICYDYSQPKICAVGINCVHPKSLQSALRSINDPNRRQTVIPLVAYPHSGIEDGSDPDWKPMDCVTEYPVQEWLNMNIRCIGGCCGVLPNNIESIRKAVDIYEKKSRFQF